MQYTEGVWRTNVTLNFNGNIFKYDCMRDSTHDASIYIKVTEFRTWQVRTYFHSKWEKINSTRSINFK